MPRCARRRIDALAGGGRFLAGLGVSGPQIVEGWYGQPWGSPYWRTRDYVAIMRKIFRRDAPVSHQGREISLPYNGRGRAGRRQAAQIDPAHERPDIPIYLGTGTEAMVKLTAEIADGWLPNGFVPGSLPEYLPWLEEGFRRAGNGKSLRNFEIQGSVHVEVNDDVKAALAALKPEVALYVGGMGHRDKNFHKDIMVRRGYREAADRIQELYLARPQGRGGRGSAGRMGRPQIAGRPGRPRSNSATAPGRIAALTGLTIRSKQPRSDRGNRREFGGPELPGSHLGFQPPYLG